MKRLSLICLLLLFPLLLASCRLTGRSEPEQVYMVSAVGFDRAGSGEFMLSVEVPLTRESETENMETKLFTGSGNTVEEALRRITEGLAKELLFSHCALMVLGDGLSREQLEAVFDFVGTGTSLPLATQVVAAPSAEALLRGGSLSTPAAGYDIPGILKRVSGILGLDIRCKIYELRANATPDQPVVLPYFQAAGEDAPQAALFSGLQILRAQMPPVSLSPEESVYYAMLAGRYIGDNGSPGGLFGAELQRVRSDLRAERTDAGLQLSLSLRMDAIARITPDEIAVLQARMETGAQELFVRLQEETGADVFFFAARLAEHQEELWSQLEPEYDTLVATAGLTVTCRIQAKESGNI